MKSVLSGVVIIAALAALPAAAQKEQTWKGVVSDSKCNGKHAAAEHDGKKMSDAECSAMCIKGGAHYVFVSAGKVYEISNRNQHSKTLASHAGQEVDLTGTLEGNTITARTITTPAK
jgi:hypothetical protein